MRLALLIIYAVIATVPLIFASVQPWIWSAYSVAVFIAFVVVLWSGHISADTKKNRFFFAAVLLFFAVTILQCLPLPPEFLSFLSPFRYEVLEKARTLIDGPPSWNAISYSPSGSVSWWIFLLSLLVFFLVMKKCISSRSDIRAVILLMITAGTFEAFYGLIQSFIPSAGVLWVEPQFTGRASGTFICSNHFAGFLEMTWPLGLGYAMSYGNWRRRDHYHESGTGKIFRTMLSSDRLFRQLFLILLTGIMLLALVFSRSRAGIAGAGIGLLTFTVVLYSANKRLSAGFWVVIGAIAGMLFIYGARIGFEPVIQRFLMLQEGGISRVDLWRDGLTIFRDHPLGIGIGNLHQVMPVYLTSRISEVTVYSHIHNDYLQGLIEAGWPGFVIIAGTFFIFLGAVLARTARLRPHDDPLRFFAAAGSASGLVSIAFHSFFDFNLQIPANCFYFVTLLFLVYICLWGRDLET